MSPLSSVQHQNPSSPRRNSVQAAHSRKNSVATPQDQVQQQSVNKLSTQHSNVHYTAILRLPFPRPDGFYDPPPVEWDASKDKTLWKLISKASNSRDLDWEAMAERFGVDLPFLLMQAAWLYERHFEGMKMQMLRLGGGGASGTASPVVGGPAGEGSGSASGSGVVKSSGRKDPRATPTLLNTTGSATKKDGVLPASEYAGSSPGTPRATQPSISRTPSTTTVTQSRLLAMAGQAQQQPNRYSRGSSGTSRRPAVPMPPPESSEDDSESALGHDDSDSGESEEPPSLLRSQAFRRPALAKKAISRLGTLNSDADAEDEDDEDDSSGGYLPFAGAAPTSDYHGNASKVQQQPHTPAATHHRHDQHHRAAAASGPSKARGSTAPNPKQNTGTETSSAASSSVTFSSPREGPTSPPMRPGPLSPRHKAELAALSPRNAGSEDSPSMGSSFSDLDVDASVTQSALEDALLSHMQRGGSVVSRVGSLGSTIGQGMERLRRG